MDSPNPDLKLLGGNPEKRFLNRELSWLSFNERVLEEADNKTHPIFERVKFLSISASNLDEFYMVRVAGLKGQVAAGVKSPTKDAMTPRQQLIAIHDRVSRLTNYQQEIWVNLTNELRENGLSILEVEELEKQEIDWLDNYFMEDIFPVLTPLAVDPVHPFPFIPNFGLTLALELLRSSDNRTLNGLLPLPGQIKRFVNLPGDNGRFIILEKIIISNIAKLFPGFSIKEVGAFRIIRDSDIEILEEAEDLVRVFETALKHRRRGNVIRLEIESSMQEELRTFVANNIGVNKEDTIVQQGILGLDRINELISESRPDLMFKSFDIRFPERIRDFSGDCFAAIQSKDIIVHHPFESFDVVVQFLRQAARDPQVVAIKQTLYRTSENSPIVRALIEAAESGKSVTAMVELKARFDEEAIFVGQESLNALVYK